MSAVETKLRAWWWSRQGLDGSLAGATPAAILERAGWARSVGGAGPYLSLFARGGTTRDDADAAAAKRDIHELPSARGCTYVVPARDYALALTLADAFGQSDVNTALKLGVTQKEIDKLCDAVAQAIGDEPMDPDAIKQATGNAVRNLGEEGKKRGMITTLPLALGILQTRGAIRRVPIGGRLDNQRYKYVRWTPNPRATSTLTKESAVTELARLFFTWVGPATLKEFQWFSGQGVKVVKDATVSLGLVPLDGTDRLMPATDAAAFAKFVAPKDPQYALVSSLDSIAAARRDVSTLVDDKDREKVAELTLGERPGAALTDLVAHAIFDRGRLIGYWEFDADEQRIVWATFAGKADKALKAKVEETEAFVRDQLGDARSFSLDSPKSRKPKLAALKQLA
jgi:hypothetical protein